MSILTEEQVKNLTFEDCIGLAYEKMIMKGRWLESGTVVISATDETNNDQYSYKIRKLGKKYNGVK